MRRTSFTWSLTRAGIASAMLAITSFASDDRPGVRGLESRTATSVFAELVESHRSGAVEHSDSLLDELSAHPRAVLRALAERAAEPTRSVDVANAALVLLSRFGLHDDVALGASLHREGAGPDLLATWTAIAARDKSTLRVLDGLVHTLSPEIQAIAVRAVETVGTLEAADWLARSAQRLPEVRGEALARLGRLVESKPFVASEEALGVVRMVLGGIGSEALREAVIAAGRLEDGDSIPHLVALLGEEDAGLRADAAWALQRITGLKLRERRERWEDWYEAELAWWRDQSDATFADLQSSAAADRTRALMEISSHRASRDRLALRVIPLLEHEDTETAKLAAWALRVLRSKCAVEPLIRALERSEPEVTREAWHALRGITRKDLPEDAVRWRSACAV